MKQKPCCWTHFPNARNKKLPICCELSSFPLNVTVQKDEDLQAIGGATSTKLKEVFVNVCPRAEQELALICAEGLEKHNDSWRSTADKTGFKVERLNHMIRHLNLYRQGDKSENHMAKVIWGCMCILHFDLGCECQNIVAMKRREK